LAENRGPAEIGSKATPLQKSDLIKGRVYAVMCEACGLLVLTHKDILQKRRDKRAILRNRLNRPMADLHVVHPLRKRSSSDNAVADFVSIDPNSAPLILSQP
jgi:hypothetical protein